MWRKFKEPGRIWEKMSIFLLAGITAFCMTACGNTGRTNGTEPVQSALQSENEQASQNGETETGKILVAYFSSEGNADIEEGALDDVDAITSASTVWNGDHYAPQVVDGEHKGNTQLIAEYIAEATGGEFFAIQVVEDERYPVEGDDIFSVPEQQLRDQSRPTLSSHVENMNEYDTIYLGFPVWNGTMPMPVFSFLEEYDFAGKTIIPFSTHEGSGLGRGKRDIESECP